MRAALLALALLVPACGPLDDGAYCRTDRDCSEVCTDLGECASLDSVRPLHIQWTIGGVQPTATAPQPCVDNRIDRLTVRINTTGGREPYEYSPVPCEAGQFSFSALPRRFDQIQVSAYAPGGAPLDSASVTVPDDQTVVTLNLL